MSPFFALLIIYKRVKLYVKKLIAYKDIVLLGLNSYKLKQELNNIFKLQAMKNKLFTIIRYILGIFLLFFGFDHFFNYIPFPEMAPEANAYFANLLSTGVMQLVGVVEIVSALAFIFNKYGALMSIILMSVSINAVLFHIALDPQKIYVALILLILNLSMLYFYKNQYSQLLKH